MSKLEELKKIVADLFDAATDKTTIEKSAVVSSKFDEAIAEEKKTADEYQSLLKDYKDVVVHSSFKPTGHEDNNAGTSVSFEDCLAEFMSKQEQK